MHKLILALLVFTSIDLYGKNIIEVVPKRTSDLPKKILVETKNSYIVRAKNASNADFDRLFWVNLDGVNLDEAQLDADILLFRKGEFAVVKADEDQVTELSQKLHHLAAACGHLIRLSGDEVSTQREFSFAPSALISSSTVIDLKDVLASMKSSDIREGVELLSSFRTRHHTTSEGAEASYEVKRMFETIVASRSDISVELVDHGQETEQMSVVVKIKGRKFPDELVLLGSHLDSISGWWGGSEAPGADDNASGTATNMTVLKAIVENNLYFDRTIEIHAYAAEEVGLVGSLDMAKKYKARNADVVSMLQNDMNLYPAMGEDGIWIVTNDTDASLNADLIKFIDRYVGIKWEQGRLQGGSSDHAAWHRQGYKAAFPFEHGSSYNPDIHTKRDVISSKLSFSQSLGFGKLSLSYLAHYAGIN